MNLQQLLDELKAEYLAKLPEKVSEIEAALEVQNYGAIEDIFHKLKGSGKTYGVAELTDLGRVIETVCQRHPEERPWVAAKAGLMIAKIRAAHLEGGTYPLSEDADFKLIQNLLARESP